MDFPKNIKELLEIKQNSEWFNEKITVLFILEEDYQNLILIENKEIAISIFIGKNNVIRIENDLYSEIDPKDVLNNTFYYIQGNFDS